MVRSPESAIEPVTTQRAYTLRLRGVDPNDTAWRDALWATHEAINKGAKAFGDWLLTLRGGLSHELAEAQVVEAKAGTKTKRNPTDAERMGRRILLALSWLSVESAPSDDADARRHFLVACGKDARKTTESALHNSELALRLALQSILRKRCVRDNDIGDPGLDPEQQKETWLGHCGPSFAARIRVDAAWVNRSDMFDAMTNGWDENAARGDAHTLISFVLGDDLLVLPTPTKSTKKQADAEDPETDEAEARQAAVKASSKGAGQRTRHPFSHLLGEGKPFGKPTRKLVLREKWQENLRPRVESSGIPVPTVDRKKKKDKDNGPAHTELLREMFSKSASRVAQIVTKQRQQEADRLARKEADKELREMEADDTYDTVLAALRSYSDEYARSSGSADAFVLRPRQISGWSRVMTRWAAINESDPEAACAARIEAVKTLQDEDEDKKFGDANLFFRLAEDRYKDVWWPDGKQPDSTILERYVKGVKARSDSERLRVAAYRHPDAFRNPIFCQFGVSRPAIHFRRLRAFTKDAAGNDPRAVGMLLWHPSLKAARLTIMHAVSRRVEHEIGSACDAAQTGAANWPEVPRRGRLGAAAAGLTRADAPSRVAGVFDLREIRSRATDDKGEGDNEPDIGKLKEPKWNGTLSARRRDLEAIRADVDSGDPRRVQRAQRLRNQLRWTLTVSMEMEGLGPWPRFVTESGDQSPFTRTVRKDEPKDKKDYTKGLKRRKGDTYLDAIGWPWDELNKPLIEKPAEKRKPDEPPSLIVDTKATRGDKACLILSRVPSLRILSLDLGHRFAAACAMWESLSAAAMKKEIAGRSITLGGTGESDLFLHTRHTDPKTGKERTTIYRRIGDDALADRSANPAPWARLERQFLIKLQGEERPARMASTEERESVARLEGDLHNARSDKNPLPWQVDELMSETVRTLRLALRKHGDAARLAFGFASDHKLMPGSRKFWFHKPQDDDREPTNDAEKKNRERAVRHREYLQDLLSLWHDLAISPRWHDDEALHRWNEDVRPLIERATFTEPPALTGDDAADTKKIKRRQEQTERWKKVWETLHAPLARRSEEDEDLDRAERKAEREAVRSLLVPVAEALRGETHKRVSLSTWWKGRWEADDKAWPKRLKGIRRWLMPRGLRARRNESSEQTKARRDRLGAAMNVGGLSLTRLATLTEFRRQVQVGYFTRLKPDGTKAEIGEKFAQRTLEAIDRMREQRVKQIASRIVEAALGVGRHTPAKGKQRDAKRPQIQKDPPCHAIVIENLRNYRFTETQPRRENKALMSWSAGKVRKYLEEGCQLHGLHLREVMPNYTSRQCSRTGLPGMRCADVPVWDFLTKPWWRKRVEDAKERKAKPTRDKPFDAEAKMLVALDELWPEPKTMNKEALPDYERKAKAAKPLRLIARGGDLFVAALPGRTEPAAERRGTRGATQADLNAAANIGLRALLDPDFPGKWWYIPCFEDKSDGTAMPRADKVRGSACFGPEPMKPEQFGSLSSPKNKENGQGTQVKRKGKGDSEAKETTNYWRDVGAGSLRPASDDGFWLSTPGYWRWVRTRTVAALWAANGLTAESPELVPDPEA